MKKFCSLIVTGLLIATACFLGACRGDVSDTEDVLIIEAYDGGYGTSFLNRIAEKFEEHNPGKKVVVSPSATLTHGETENKLKAGPRYTTTDMFLANSANFNQFVSKGSQMVSGYDCVLEDLSGVYHSKVYGEDILLKDKLKPEYVDYYTYNNGKQYSMAWTSGINGIVYHADVFKEKGWVVPRTTNELTDVLIPQIKRDGWTPVTWPGAIGYWIYALMPWWAQYEGTDNFNAFFKCKDSDGNYTDEMFKQEGRYEALQVLEDVIADKNGNNYTGSIALNHTRSQMLFLDKEVNRIAMIPNGDWLENEMEGNFPVGSVNIEMMKTPVISSIIHRTPSIANDDVLIRVIAHIDGEEGATRPSGVTDADYKIIRGARQISFSPGFEHMVLIPAYANAKELAKSFLLYMASDEAHQIYFEETTSMLPFRDYDPILKKQSNIDKMTVFQKSKYSLMEDAHNITTMYYLDPLFYKAGLRPFNQNVWPDPIIGGIGIDAVSASDYFANEYNYVHDRWDTYKINAGVANL